MSDFQLTFVFIVAMQLTNIVLKRWDKSTVNTFFNILGPKDIMLNIHICSYLSQVVFVFHFSIPSMPTGVWETVYAGNKTKNHKIYIWEVIFQVTAADKFIELHEFLDTQYSTHWL